MVKLKGVSTVNMQDGKITGISYEGAVYAGVDVKAQAGDIIYVTETNPFSDTLSDAYYGVINDPRDGGITYIDETGDKCYVGGPKSTTFRNINAKPAPSIESLDKRVTALEAAKQAAKPATEKRHAKVGERILITKAISANGRYKEGDVLTVTEVRNRAVSVPDLTIGIFHEEYEVIVEPTQAKPEISKAPADLITHKGADYSLVQRKAQPGDVVVFTETTSSSTSINVPYGPVTNSDGELLFKSGHSVYRKRYNRTLSTVLVYEKVVAVEPPLKVGDYAKVVEMPTIFNKLYKAGEIVQITKVDYSDIPYEAKGVNSEETRWFRKAQVVKATDTEVEQALAGGIFTKHGRRLNEFKVGDIVRVLDPIGTVHLKVGQITEVTESDGTDSPDVKSNDGGTRYAKVELIAPVESRVDVK